MDCQYGHHYFRKHDSKGKRLCLQGTRKIGCHATIRIKTFILYPEYAIGDVSGKSARQIKLLQENQLELLRKAIAEGDDICKVSKYFVSLPSEAAHSGHPTGSSGGYAQRIHPLLSDKISQLVAAGITDTNEVRRSLRFYVTNTLCKELGYQAKQSDRALYPTTTDIRNHVYSAKKALELSKLDQENTRLKIDQWQSTNSESSYFFRPFVLQDGEPAVKEEDKQRPSLTCSQTLLVIHQEKWQKQLLERYGNTMSMLDATYKTMKYELALFFLCVRTNVGYSVVAEFIVQEESAEKIAEALGVIKQWNPSWNPSFFMTDYSEAELLAIEQVFPSAKSFICDFHREQAWERWVRDHKHGLTKEQGEELLRLLRACASEESSDPSFGHPVDHSFQQRVTELKASSLWKNDRVKQWLSTKWLCCAEVSSVNVYIELVVSSV